MTWLTTHDSVIINSYAAAKRHYDNFTPIRGRDMSETGAALCARNAWSRKSLHKLDGDAYGFRLYETDVVQVHPDDSIVVDLTYQSQSTDAWADTYLGMLVSRFASVRSGHHMLTLPRNVVAPEVLEAYDNETKPSERSPYLYFFRDDGMFELKPREYNGRTTYTVVDPDLRYTKRVNKSGAHGSRKPLQPFLNYLKLFEQTPLSHDAVLEISAEFRDKYDAPYTQSVVGMIAERPEDEELWVYGAAYWHTRDYDWRAQSHVSVLESMRSIKNALYQHKYETDGLHSYTPLPIGACKSTRLYTQKDVDLASV